MKFYISPKGEVLSHTPVGRPGESTDVKYYGGYLVAESIPSAEIARLIASAPDLVELGHRLVNAWRTEASHMAARIQLVESIVSDFEAIIGRKP